MGFSQQEKQAMLQLSGVGPTVISRLEQLGFNQLSQLCDQESGHLTQQIAMMMHATCWHNSPKARLAIQGIIDLAKQINDPVNGEDQHSID